MAPPRKSVVLVDTMAIKAAHDLRCWNALRNHYQLHTVLMCIHEATCRDKSGYQLVARKAVEVESEVTIGEVTDKMRAELLFRLGLRADIHRGERDLLAYALTFSDAWWLCGPDNGTFRALHELKLLDRMVSLEEIARASGQSKTMPSKHYTERWLSDRRTQTLLGEI